MSDVKGRFNPSSPLTVVYVTGAAGFANYFLLISLVPKIAAVSGSALDAGLITTVFMIASVLAAGTVHRLARIMSPRTLLATALLLLGIPTLIYEEEVGSRAGLLTLTAVRGLGFGLMAVTTSTLMAVYSTHERRGRTVGTYGFITSSLATFFPALGLLLGQQARVVPFALGASLTLIPSLALLRTPFPTGTVWTVARSPSARPRSLWLVIIAFTAITIEYGAIFSFLPLVTDINTPDSLIAIGSSFAFNRWLAGHLMDKGLSCGWVLLVSGFCGSVGLIGLARTSTLSFTLVFSVIVGGGIGGACTGSFVALMSRSGKDQVTRAIVLWNVAFDLGIAAGGVGLGYLVRITSPSTGLALAGLFALVIGVPAGVLDVTLGPRTTSPKPSPGTASTS
jgi:predicted MFS family arabinose efflux permease